METEVYYGGWLWGKEDITYRDGTEGTEGQRVSRTDR